MSAERLGSAREREIAMFGLGATELLIILALVLVLFGAGKIPQLGRGLGEGIRNFKRGLKGDEETPPSGDRQLPSEPNSSEPRR